MRIVEDGDIRVSAVAGAQRPAARLLVGADAFWRQAERDIRAAKTRVYVQAMTFEADEAGAAVARALVAAGAPDRKVLVDDFTRYVISDAFVASPRYLGDRLFRQEVRDTHAMFRALQREGVGVRVTNPVGWRLDRLPFRNHKKLIVADDVAYIGGVNFSDHNFAWDDLMLRIADPAVAACLAEDFGDTFAGRPRAWAAHFPHVSLYGLDGRDNARRFSALLDEIDDARDSICVVSPYLTFPFFDALARAAARGVAVRLITPLANNKPIVRDYLLPAARKAGVEVRLMPNMIHTKGMLIDGRTLVLGSSNFDFVSYHVEAEFMAILRDEGLARQFQQEVVEPYLARTVPASAHRPKATGAFSFGALKLASWLIRVARPRHMPVVQDYR